MKHGFIKTVCFAPEIRVADVEYNKASIERAYTDASIRGAALFVAPELSLTGATCGDIFAHSLLIDAAERSLAELVKVTENYNTVMIAGLPVRVSGALYDAAAVIANGKILGIVPRRNVNGMRNFASAPLENKIITVAGCETVFGQKQIFGCGVLPDFTFAVTVGADATAPRTISSDHAAAGANVIVAITSESEIIGSYEARLDLARAESKRLSCGFILQNAGEGESTSEGAYSGQGIVAECGKLLAYSQPFSGETAEAELDVCFIAAGRMKSNFNADSIGYNFAAFSLELTETKLTRKISPMPFVPSDATECAKRCKTALDIQVAALKKRIAHTHAKGAVVGISGGLDSCLALLVSTYAMDALGRPRTDVHAVTMPCFGTTGRTRSNAELLCRELGVTFLEVNIADAVRLHMRDIGQDESIHDVTYENCQARERTQVLMDIANRTGAIVIGTGDLSEGALGWSTYNGDHMSMYGVNCSLPKTFIRHVVAYCAERTETDALASVLRDILATPVSPELLPAVDGVISQCTEDIVGPYELHDFFIYHFLARKCSPEKLYRIALYAFDGIYDGVTIKKWLVIFLRRFFTQQFKRSCTPDGPKVGSVALSPRGELMMPSDAVAKLWLDEAERL